MRTIPATPAVLCLVLGHQESLWKTRMFNPRNLRFEATLCTRLALLLKKYFVFYQLTKDSFAPNHSFIL